MTAKAPRLTDRVLRGLLAGMAAAEASMVDDGVGDIPASAQADVARALAWVRATIRHRDQRKDPP